MQDSCNFIDTHARATKRFPTATAQRLLQSPHPIGLFCGDLVLTLTLDFHRHLLLWPGLQSPSDGLNRTSKHVYQFEGSLGFGRNHVDKSLVEHSTLG